MSESLEVLEKFLNFIFKNKWEPCSFCFFLLAVDVMLSLFGRVMLKTIL